MRCSQGALCQRARRAASTLREPSAEVGKREESETVGEAQVRDDDGASLLKKVLHGSATRVDDVDALFDRLNDMLPRLVTTAMSPTEGLC